MVGRNHGEAQGDCAQAENIEKIERGVADLTVALSKIAAQDERLNGLDTKNKEQDHSLDTLYERIRHIDMVLGIDGDGIRMKVTDALAPFKIQMDRLERLLDIVFSKSFKVLIVGLASMVIVGAVCDLAYHYALIGKLITWFVGLWQKVPR